MKRKKEIDYGKSGREMLYEMGLLNIDPNDNIKMPIRKSKEYIKNDSFRRKFIPFTKKEEFEYSVILAQKMLSQFRWLPWMRPFIDELGNPKSYGGKTRSRRQKIEINKARKRKKIEL